MRVDPQELAEQRVEALAGAVRVAGSAAIAGSDPEVAVGPELKLAPIVVATRVGIERTIRWTAGIAVSPLGAARYSAIVIAPFGLRAV